MDAKIKSALYIVKNKGECNEIKCATCFMRSGPKACSVGSNKFTEEETYVAWKLETATKYIAKHHKQAFDTLL